MSDGRLTLQDLRQCIGEAAPTATAVIAAALGETPQALYHAVAAGQVSTNSVIIALVNELRERGSMS